MLHLLPWHIHLQGMSLMSLTFCSWFVVALSSGKSPVGHLVLRLPVLSQSAFVCPWVPVYFLCIKAEPKRRYRALMDTCMCIYIYSFYSLYLKSMQKECGMYTGILPHSLIDQDTITSWVINLFLWPLHLQKMIMATLLMVGIHVISSLMIKMYGNIDNSICCW